MTIIYYYLQFAFLLLQFYLQNQQFENCLNLNYLLEYDETNIELGVLNK